MSWRCDDARLSVRGETSDIAAARVVDRRRVAVRRLAANDLAARIVGRGRVAVRRRAAGRSTAAITERRGGVGRRVSWLITRPPAS